MNKKTIGAAAVVISKFALFAILLSLLFRFKLGSLGRTQLLQIAMNLFAMSLGIILFIICTIDRDEYDSLKVRFLAMENVVFVALFCDSVSWILAGHPQLRTFCTINDTVLFFGNPFTSYLFYEYVKEYIGGNDTRLTKVVAVLMRIGLGISVLMRLINIFVPIYFYYDEAAVYHRGSLYVMSYMFSFASALVVLRMILTHRDRLRRYQFFILLGFILTPIMAIAVNIVFYGLTPAFAAMMAVLSSFYVILNMEKTRDNYAVERELSIATMMQRGMLPNMFPEVTNTKEYDLFATMTPAKEVGGDFYDFFMIDDNRLAFLIADVSDKGIGAALFMAVSKAMIKMRAQAGGSPAEVLSDVDKRLGKDNDQAMFVTVWLGYLDLTTGHVVACNAGHDYPALYLKSKAASGTEGYTIEETVHGLAIAVFPGLEFPEIEFTMEPGDRIFLYTDGVNEAQRTDGEQFGFDRLIDVLNRHINDSCETVCHEVKKAVDGFVGRDPQFDDMTMLALAYKGARRG